ncbi:MAG: caspase family protein, partial [Planctomycetia bacterium]|nr:caspase family protein [Planctomycetia bacterium]
MDICRSGYGSVEFSGVDLFGSGTEIQVRDTYDEESRMKRRALIIGVDTYQAGCFNDLSGAVRDAHQIATLLGDRFPREYRFDVEFLANPEAEEVKRKLTQIQNLICEDLNSEWTFFLYFAGHGIRRGQTDQPLLLCTDASADIVSGLTTDGGITAGVLAEFTSHVPADMIFCYDVCRSSVTAVHDGDTGGSAAFREIVLRQEPQFPGRRRQPLRWSLSSCEDGQLAGDDGFFARSLTEEIVSRPGSDSEILTNEEFVTRIENRMHALGATQRPVFAGHPVTLIPARPSTNTPADPPGMTSCPHEAEGQTERKQSTLPDRPESPATDLREQKKVAEELFLKGERYALREFPDWENAVKYYREAAEQGHAVAMTTLGDCYHDGIGVPPNCEEAVKWFRRAADAGDLCAFSSLGMCLGEMDSVPGNSREASVCIEKFIATARTPPFVDDRRVQNDLGWCYEAGAGVPQDHEEAAKWYRKSAEQGLAMAQNNLGWCCEAGAGVPQDYEEAAKWFRRAAEQGHAGAQNELGWCYQKGRGVSQDNEEATKWYRRAAEQGDAAAQSNLGVCYADGEGVPQDYEEAAKWFRKSAEQGHAGAQNELGGCYHDGRGVSQDDEEA